MSPRNCLLFPDFGILIIVPAAPISGIPWGIQLLLLLEEDGAWAFRTEVVWRSSGQ